MRLSDLTTPLKRPPLADGHILNRKPSPRILAVNLEYSASLVEHLEKVAETFEHAPSLSGIRQEEWDLIVLASTALGGYAQRLEPTSNALILASPHEHEFDLDYSNVARISVVHSDHDTTEFMPQEDGLSVDLRRLIASDIFNRREGSAWARSHLLRHRDTNSTFQQIAHDGDGDCLALLYAPSVEHERSPKAGIRAVIPDCVGDPAAWVECMIKEVFSKVLPGRFPTHVNEDFGPEWKTHEELEASQGVSNLRAKMLEVQEQQRLDLAAAEKVREEAEATAKSGARRLLTDRGETLVVEVARVLRLLGFEVEDRDESATPGDFLEDLRIKSEDWVSIAEVKGYSKGARIGDTLKLGRHVERFILTENFAPNRRWLIANHSCHQPPSGRGCLFSSSPSDMEAFAHADGLAIDTRDLFKIERAYRSARNQPKFARDIRAAMMEATGVFSWG